MEERFDKFFWRQLGLLALSLLISLVFPFALIFSCFIAYGLYDKVTSPPVKLIPFDWDEVDGDGWLQRKLWECESPAEEAFLNIMVKEFGLRSEKGKMVSPALQLDMQVKCGRFRFDFVANGRQVIEIDGAAWHSSPEQVERDRLRDEFSIEEGYKVLRIPAIVVFKRPGQAIEMVRTALAETPVFTKPVAKPAEQQSLWELISGIGDALTSASSQSKTVIDDKDSSCEAPAARAEVINEPPQPVNDLPPIPTTTTYPYTSSLLPSSFIKIMNEEALRRAKLPPEERAAEDELHRAKLTPEERAYEDALIERMRARKSLPKGIDA